MFLRLGFILAVLYGLYVIFGDPIKRWLQEKNPFPGYDPLATDVTITYDEDDPAAQRLAFQLQSYLAKHGMGAVPFPVAIGNSLPEADLSTTTSTSNAQPKGIEVHINRSN